MADTVPLSWPTLCIIRPQAKLALSLEYAKNLRNRIVDEINDSFRRNAMNR